MNRRRTDPLTSEELETQRKKRREVRRQLARVEGHTASLEGAHVALGEAFRDAQRSGVTVLELEDISGWSHTRVYRYMRLDEQYEAEKQHH